MANSGVETGSATAEAAPGAGTATTAHQRGHLGRMRLSRRHFSRSARCCRRAEADRSFAHRTSTLPSHSLPPTARDMRLSHYRLAPCRSPATPLHPADASESMLATPPVSSHGLYTPSSSPSSLLRCPESSASTSFTACGRNGSGTPAESIVLPSQFDIRSTRRRIDAGPCRGW